jgi:hypothetical protein
MGSYDAEILDPTQLAEGESFYFSRESALFGELGFESLLALRVTGSATNELFRKAAFPVTDEGGFQIDPTAGGRVRPVRRTVRFEPPPTVVITPASLQTSLMAGMWERVLRLGGEREATVALQILQPDIDGIFFLPGDRAMRGRGGVLVSLRGTKRRVPLGSLGEGMRRILALAVSLAQARKGFLLIDEIDTGLHWSVMARMWELTLRRADDLGVQVFATTHSLDCLRGLKAAVDEHGELRKVVRVHKVDTSLREAVTFTSDELAVAIDQEIEVRG